MKFSSVCAALVCLVLGGCDAPSTRVEDVTLDWTPQDTPVEIGLVSLSDWRGEIESAPLMAAFWGVERDTRPTLFLGTGDAYGASSAESGLFAELPAVLTLRAMGLDVDTLGNHNFDRGLPHLQAMIDASTQPITSAFLDTFWETFVPDVEVERLNEALQDLALPSTTYVATNLSNIPQNLRGVQSFTLRNVGGVPVSVTGVLYEGATEVVFPGSFGTMDILVDTEEPQRGFPVTAACETRAFAEEAGATLHVLLAHIPDSEDPPSMRLESEIAGTITAIEETNGTFLLTALDADGEPQEQRFDAAQVVEVIVSVGETVAVDQPIARLTLQVGQDLLAYVQELAAQPECDFDVVLGMSNPSTVACKVYEDRADCWEPGWEPVPDGNGVLLIQNQERGESYSVARLNVEPSTGEAFVVQVDEVVPSLPAPTSSTDLSVVEQLVSTFLLEAERAQSKVLGLITEPFDLSAIRVGEAALGNLYADVIRLSGANPLRPEAFGADIGVINAGGIRDTLPADLQLSDPNLDAQLRRPGEPAPFHLITKDIFTSLPFPNAIVTKTLTGQQVWQMLEHSVSRLPEASGLFGHFSGIRFTFDTRQASGCPANLSTCLVNNQQNVEACLCEISRIQEVFNVLEDGTLVPLEANDARYAVATNDFLAQGGDGYIVLTLGGLGIPAEKLMREAVESFFSGSLLEQQRGACASEPPTCQTECQTLPNREEVGPVCAINPAEWLQGRLQDVSP